MVLKNEQRGRKVTRKWGILEARKESFTKENIIQSNNGKCHILVTHDKD